MPIRLPWPFLADRDPQIILNFLHFDYSPRQKARPLQPSALYTNQGAVHPILIGIADSKDTAIRSDHMIHSYYTSPCSRQCRIGSLVGSPIAAGGDQGKLKSACKVFIPTHAPDIILSRGSVTQVAHNQHTPHRHFAYTPLPCTQERGIV